MSSKPFQLKDLRFKIIADSENPKALKIAESLQQFSHRKPNCIVVIGGDGFMLSAIHQNWRKNLPFLGINAGHRGHLLNDATPFNGTFPTDYHVHELRLLDVEIELQNGKTVKEVAFGDAWVERQSPQAAWAEVKVNDIVRIPKLVCDAVLVATPAGSTGYAMSMGAHPITLDSQMLILVGSNVYLSAWKTANIDNNSVIEFQGLNSEKRPISAHVDGVRYRNAKRMKVSLHPSDCVRLLFLKEYLLSEKLIRIQFPQLSAP